MPKRRDLEELLEELVKLDRSGQERAAQMALSPQLFRKVDKRLQEFYSQRDENGAHDFLAFLFTVTRILKTSRAAFHYLTEINVRRRAFDQRWHARKLREQPPDERWLTKADHQKRRRDEYDRMLRSMGHL